MELLQIVLMLIALVCFLEWNHLKKNNIRHDELYFLYAGIILIIILIVTLFFETEDIKKLF